MPGDCHSSCKKLDAKVALNPHGVKHGWAYWPLNFDPIWIESCDSFKQKESEK